VYYRVNPYLFERPEMNIWCPEQKGYKKLYEHWSWGDSWAVKRLMVIKASASLTV
jgi:hypothetical protein